MYNPAEHPRLAESLSKLGATIEDMAGAIGVDAAVIEEWIEEHEEFKRAITKGRILSDMVVAESLFERATGYYREVDQIVRTQDGFDVMQVRKYFPASPTAAIWWLKNRQKDKWSDRPDTGSGEHEKMQIDGGLPEMPYEQQELDLNAENNTPDTA